MGQQLRRPIFVHRLALLQVQQLDATRDLLRLRDEQLKLRRQQLSALRGLLSSFVCVHGGTNSTSQVCT